MSRKLLTIFAALVIAASLCACNNGNEEVTTDGGQIEISTEGTDDNDETHETEESSTGDEIDPPVEDNPGDLTYTEKNDKIYVLAPSGALNLRTADYEIKTSVITGTELSRIGISTDGIWSKIVFEEETLYVNNKYITGLAVLDAGFSPAGMTLVSVGSLKCHIAPEEDEAWQADVKIVKWYEAGDEIKVVGVNEETGWYKVEFTAYDGSEAYGYVVINDELYENKNDDSADNTSPETFKVDNMSITLTSDFEAQNIEGYTATYIDEKNAVGAFIIQENFSLLEGFEDWTLDEYASVLKSSVPESADVGDTKTEDGIKYFEYQFTNTELDLTYYYYTVVFKDTDCFWTVQFTCLAEDKEEGKTAFAEYAQSIKFAE